MNIKLGLATAIVSILSAAAFVLPAAAQGPDSAVTTADPSAVVSSAAASDIPNIATLSVSDSDVVVPFGQARASFTVTAVVSGQIALPPVYSPMLCENLDGTTNSVRFSTPGTYVEPFSIAPGQTDTFSISFLGPLGCLKGWVSSTTTVTASRGLPPSAAGLVAGAGVTAAAP